MSKSAAVVTSDEDENSEVEEPIETQLTTTPARPKPRPAYRDASAAEEHEPVTESDNNVLRDIAEASAALTPTSRPKLIYRGTNSPRKESKSRVNGTSTPAPSRKRVREGEEEQSETERGSPEQQGTPPSDIQVRRKRVRH